MQTLRIGGHVFEVERDRIEVTSLNRPDPQWRYTDSHNHLHQWYVVSANGAVTAATSYSASERFVLPTLERIVDVPATDEYPAISHDECVLCRDRIQPGRCPDPTAQFIPGIARYYIDGDPVTADEFRRRYEALQS